MIFYLDGFHAAMPGAQMRLGFRQRVMTGEKEIFQHPEQIEIHEPRTFARQKFRVLQHFGMQNGLNGNWKSSTMQPFCVNRAALTSANPLYSFAARV